MAAPLEPSTPGQRLRALQAQVDRHPNDPAGWRQLAEQRQAWGQLEEALPCLERAQALAPSDITVLSQLGHLYRNLSWPERAFEHHSQALRLQPDSLTLALNQAFVLPVVAESSAQIERSRQSCLELFEAIERRRDWRWYPEHVGTCHPFYLAYHGRNDRELLERYGSLLTRWTGNLTDPPAAPPAPATSRRPRPRLGLLSGFFHDHSHGRAFEGLITHLNPARLDTVLIHLATAPRDATSERLDQACSRVVRLPANASQAATALRELGLDALFFTDLGMHPLMTLLATQRLAPLQLAGWGWPLTSGMPRIDHYISAAAVEAEDAGDHYSETLVRLPGLPCCYPSSLLAHPALPREYFLLPPDGLLLGCLQPMQKLHPDFDAVLERIATAVPEVRVVLVCDRTPTLTQRVLARLERRAPQAHRRTLVLAQMTRPEFMALAGELDLLLDPPSFGSGVSFFEVAHRGTPVVSLEGRFLRNRLVAAAYRLIGLEDAPVASSLEAFGDLVITLLKDQPRRLRLRQRFGDLARQRLYDRQEGVRGLEDWLEATLAEQQSP